MPPSIPSPARTSGLGLRVLYVEDDADVQEMLQTLLELHGYSVETAGTAAEGLEVLRRERFHVVIADYNLPDGDGASMLAEAAREGRLECESMIITGAYALTGNATAFRVLRKPIDANAFIAKLDEILAPVREAELANVVSQVSPTTARGEDCVELFLYVSEASRSSLRAARKLEALLRSYDASKVAFRIVNVGQERPPEFDEDRIAFTPTLVKRRPGPKVYFLGALDDVDHLTELLGEHAGGSEGALDDPQGRNRRPRT